MPYAIAGGGPGDFFGAAIANACRFNDDDTAHLSRTPSASDRDTWTFSTWVKRNSFGSGHTLFSAGIDGNDVTSFVINSNDRINYVHNFATVTVDSIEAEMKHRDPSAWFHVVLAVDTTHGTEASRIRIYVNGVELTDLLVANYPAQSVDTYVGSANTHYVGRVPSGAYLDGYLAETIYIDGQALTPASFGEAHPVTGQWVPKTYTGSYGANGFRLDYANASDLGNDVSGNNNDWTSSGLATNDQVPDTPTDNHCVLNAARPGAGTLANGNLDASGTVDAQGTFGVAAGKFAWEVTLSSGGAAGIESAGGTENTFTGIASDVIQFRLDMDAGTADRNVNAAGWVSLATDLTGVQFPLVKTPCTVDFGQHGYTPPAGYKFLTARNLDDPGILRGDDFFAANLRSGTGASGSVSDLRFAPDLVWNKSRDEGAGSYTGDHKIWDAVRGVTKSLESNTSDNEATESTGLTAFNSDGFDFGALDQINFSGDLFVDWCWKRTALAGVDIVQYSGDNTANRNIAHGLGVTPNFALVKRLDAAEDWFAHHADLMSEDYFLKLNEQDAQTNTASPFGTGNWSATQFMVDNDGTNNANASGTDNYIAYLFASVPGFSRFGTYTGNGDADGPFVWCGFLPKFVLVKRIETGGFHWVIQDGARGPHNEIVGEASQANDAASEADIGNAYGMDFLSNGIKHRSTSLSNNASGGTYIFAAFAEAPFKFARAR